MEGLDAIIQLILLGSACLYPVGLLFPCHGCCDPIQYEVYCGCLEFEFEEKLTPPTLSRRHSCDEGVVEGRHYYYRETLPVHGWSAGARTRREAGVRTRCATYQITVLAKVFNQGSRYKKPDGSYVYPRNLSGGESASRTGTIEFRRDGSDECDAGRGTEDSLPTDIETIRTVTTTINGYDSWLDHDPIGGTVSSYSPLEQTSTAKEMPKFADGSYTSYAESVSTPVTVELDSAAVFSGNLSLFDGSVLTEQALLAMASVEVEYTDNSTESKYEVTYTYEADPDIFRYSGDLEVGYLYTITHGDKVEKLRAFVNFSLPGPFDPVPGGGLQAVALPEPEDETAEPSETTTAVESVNQTSSQIDVTVQAGDIYPPGDYALPVISYTPTGEDKLGNFIGVDDSDASDGATLPIDVETECDGETLIWGAPCMRPSVFTSVAGGLAGNVEGRPVGREYGPAWANVVFRPEYDTKNYSFDEQAIQSFLDNGGSLSFYTKQESPGATLDRAYSQDDGSAPVLDDTTISEIQQPRQTADMEVSVSLSSDLQYCNESLCGYHVDDGNNYLPVGNVDISPAVLESIAPPSVLFSYSDQRRSFVEGELACGVSANSLAVKRFGCSIPRLELPTSCLEVDVLGGFSYRPVLFTTGDFGNHLAHFACGDLRWVIKNGFCRTLIENRSQHVVLENPILGSVATCQDPYEMNVELGAGEPQIQKVGCLNSQGETLNIGPGNRCPPASIEMTVQSNDSPLAGTYVLEKIGDTGCSPFYRLSVLESGVLTRADYSEQTGQINLNECPVRLFSASVSRTEELDNGRIKYEYLSDITADDQKDFTGANTIYTGQLTEFYEETSGSYSTNINESEWEHVALLKTEAEWTAGQLEDYGDEWFDIETGVLKAGYRLANLEAKDGSEVLYQSFPSRNSTPTDRTMTVYEYNNAYLTGTHRSTNREDLGFSEDEVDVHGWPIFYANPYLSREEGSGPQFVSFLQGLHYEWTRDPRKISLTISGDFAVDRSFYDYYPGEPPLVAPEGYLTTCISIDPPVDWITQYDEPYIAFDYAANTTGSPRSATLTLSINDFTETWTITQPAFDYAGAFTEVDGIEISEIYTGVETNKSAIVVKGTAKPDADVSVLTFSSEANVRSNSEGRWTATVALSGEPEGTTTLTVRCFVDGLDGPNDYYNVRTELLSPSVYITIDRTPPDSPTITLPADGASVGDTFSVTVSCEDEAEVRLFVDGVLKDTLERDGTSVTGSVSGLSPGNHTITATATDKAGNVSAPSDPVTVEVIA